MVGEGKVKINGENGNFGIFFADLWQTGATRVDFWILGFSISARRRGGGSFL